VVPAPAYEHTQARRGAAQRRGGGRRRSQHDGATGEVESHRCMCCFCLEMMPVWLLTIYLVASEVLRTPVDQTKGGPWGSRRYIASRPSSGLVAPARVYPI